MEYFLSDSHFYHANIIRLCNRPFPTTDVMNKTIFQNILNVVSERDIFYFLGDWSWDENEGVNLWKQIPGKKYFIQGNHDNSFVNNMFRLSMWEKTNTTFISGYLDTTFHGFDFTLCHYPMISWNKSHFGAKQIYGHHHGNYIIQEKFPGKRVDVGVEVWDYKPVSFDTLIKKFDTLPENWDLKRKQR